MDNRCIFCGEPVPEGMQVCLKCRWKLEAEARQSDLASCREGDDDER